jgi:hypothetical protein
MKNRLLAVAIAAATLTVLGGCIVAPPPVPVRAAYVAPVGVAYIAPTYAMPGPGYVWEYHPHYGWGWHHPVHGWHRGWN